MYKVLMVMGEVDIGLIPAPLPPIIQVCLVNHWVFLVMAMIELDIGLRPANFLHITMVKYTLSAQGFLDNLFQGVFKEKIHIKIIPNILIQECHHNQFFCVNISLLILCMNLM